MNTTTRSNRDQSHLDHIRIFSPGEGHRADWERLYHGYANFYGVPMDDTILATVWGWIQDPDMRFWARLAETEAGHPGNPASDVSNHTSGVTGLMHYREMPSPLRGGMIGFLDDLFVDPEQRGSGVVDALFGELQQQVQANNWACIRWITADNNYRGRGCYDRHANKTHWVTYQLDRS